MLIRDCDRSSRLSLHHPFTVDLTDQVNQWATYASNVIPHPPNETLVAWWIGINDTGDTVANTTACPLSVLYPSPSQIILTYLPSRRTPRLSGTARWSLSSGPWYVPSPHQPPKVLSLTVPGLHQQQQAYDHNLRGTYLFINVPPIDRAPAWHGNARAPFYKQNITEYNAALSAHTKACAQNHTDVNVLTFDANTWFGQILDNAAAYGFKNTTRQASISRHVPPHSNLDMSSIVTASARTRTTSGSVSPLAALDSRHPTQFVESNPYRLYPPDRARPQSPGTRDRRRTGECLGVVLTGLD